VKNTELSQCQNIEDLMWFLSSLLTILFFPFSVRYSVFGALL